MNALSARNVWTADSKFRVISRGCTEYGETLRRISGTEMMEKDHLDVWLIAIVNGDVGKKDFRLLVELIKNIYSTHISGQEIDRCGEVLNPHHGGQTLPRKESRENENPAPQPLRGGSAWFWPVPQVRTLRLCQPQGVYPPPAYHQRPWWCQSRPLCGLALRGFRRPGEKGSETRKHAHNREITQESQGNFNIWHTLTAQLEEW